MYLHIDKIDNTECSKKVRWQKKWKCKKIHEEWKNLIEKIFKSYQKATFEAGKSY